MGGAHGKLVRRAITSSWGRFLAIAAIVALGCGFYAGLHMVGRDMRLAADDFYDGTHLYDLRVVCTMGLTQDEVDQIADTDGVEAVMPSRSTDVMAGLDDDQYVVRVSSLPAAAPGGATSEDGMSVSSDDDSYLNRVELVEGSWPAAPDECVLSYDCVMREELHLGDTMQVLYGTSDLDGVLDQRTFRVVGLVRDADYVDATMLGSTTLGSGVVEQYAYVPSEAFSGELPYTQVYATVEGAAAQQAYGDGYQKVVDRVADRLEGKAYSIALSRLDGIRAAAEAQLREGQEQYERQGGDASQRLGDAREQLASALAQIERSQRQLDSASSALDGSREALDQERQRTAAELARQRQELDQAQASLDAAAAQAGMSDDELDAAERQLRDDRSALARRRSAWRSTDRDMQRASSALDDAAQTLDVLASLSGSQDESQARPVATQVRSSVRALRRVAEGRSSGDDPQALADARALAGQIADGLSGLDAGARPEEFLEQVQALDAGELQTWATSARAASSQLAQARSDGGAQLDAQQADVEARQERLSQTRDQLRELARQRRELEAARQRYDRQASTAQQRLGAMEGRLADAQGQLDSGQDALDAGRAQYEEGKASYDVAQAQADEGLADAAQQLRQARSDIRSLKAPDVYVLDRTKGFGQATYASNATRIDRIAAVFPLFFFLVAALVALTSMTRMVEDDRGEIGTLKALGYTTGQIAGKYLTYALLASGAGAVVGILFLSQLLPYVVMDAYGIMYVIPMPPLPLPVDVPCALLSGGAGVGITLLATYAAVAAEMRVTPASLMLPKAPKAGKRILLERVGPLWRHLSFSWKVTFRNLFRYKRRLLMTIFGIAGCTALLLTGLGVRNSIQDIIDKQYGEIVHYDLVVGMDEDATDEDWDAVLSYLRDAAGTGEVARTHDLNMQAGTGSGDTMAVQVTVPEDPQAFCQLVTMRTRVGHDLVTLDDDAVVLSEKLATELGVGVGDSITIYDQDTIGNATGDGYQLTVTGVTENYVRHYVYVGKDAFQAATGSAPSFEHLYASAPGDAAAHRHMMSDLVGMEGVGTAVFNDETISTYNSMLSTVDQVMVILVVAAALLAFIVLYNLTNINISERVREIASLKVLGFTRGEVAAYVYRETILLTVMGALVGLVAGVAMEQFVIVTAEVDMVMFGREIHPTSFAVAFGMTIFFTVFVMVALYPKLVRIDMVESLKSVD